MSYLNVKWNRSGYSSPADVRVIRALLCFDSHSWNGSLRRRRRRAKAEVEGVAIAGY